jgi:hypothetical protein
VVAFKPTRNFAGNGKPNRLKSFTLLAFFIERDLIGILVSWLRMTTFWIYFLHTQVLIFSDQYTSPKIIKLMELENEKSEIEALTNVSAGNKKRLVAIEN